MGFYKILDDRKLVELCLKRDQGAWNEFVDRYSKLLYSKIHTTLEVLNCYFLKDNIDDIFQDVYIKIIKSMEKLKNLKFFKAWLIRIAYTVTIDYIRYECAKRNKCSKEDISEIEFICFDEAGQEEEIVEKEIEQNLDIAIKKLDSKETVIIKMIYIYNKKLREVAEILGTTTNVIFQIKNKAEKKLYNILKEEYGYDSS